MKYVWFSLIGNMVREKRDRLSPVSVPAPSGGWSPIRRTSLVCVFDSDNVGSSLIPLGKIPEQIVLLRSM